MFSRKTGIKRGTGSKKAGLVITAILVFSVGLSLSLTTAQAANPTSTLGVYRGAANPNGVNAFAQWLGAPVSYAEDFLPGDSWSAIESPMWLLDSWKGTSHRMVYGVPIIPDTGGSLAEGAAGTYNAHFEKLAENLVATGQSNAILRLGWEFGGGWYHWAVSNQTDAANYAAYWRQIVTTMRAAAPNLSFDWNPIWGWQSVDPTAAYPGDAYVDYIGIDVYDQSWTTNYTDPVARWNDAVTAQWGLTWHRNFAAAHNKPMSFPEWGVAIRSDGHGGGDAPYFIQQMTQWIAQNNVGYHVYFAFDAPDGAHDLMDGSFPNAAAAFKNALGAAASVETGTTATQTTTTSATTTTTTTTTTPTSTTPTQTSTTTSTPSTSTTVTSTTQTTPTTTSSSSTVTSGQKTKARSIHRRKISRLRTQLICARTRGVSGQGLARCIASLNIEKIAKRTVKTGCSLRSSYGAKSSTAQARTRAHSSRCSAK